MVILAFAFVQVVIQVVFFLHLGRGPKPRWNLYFFISTLVIVGFVVGGSIVIINNLHYNMAPQDAFKKLVTDEGIAQVGGTKTGACAEIHKNHVIYFVNGKVTPIHTEAQYCDTLSFVNQDSVEREVAFGVHPAHIPYAGVSEFPLTKRKDYTITLSEAGTYEFHDHDHPDAFGTFTVSKP
jgi:plastocyanin